jgi:hypothetical protein
MADSAARCRRAEALADVPRDADVAAKTTRYMLALRWHERASERRERTESVSCARCAVAAWEEEGEGWTGSNCPRPPHQSSTSLDILLHRPSCKTTAALQGPSTTVLIAGEDHLFLSLSLSLSLSLWFNTTTDWVSAKGDVEVGTLLLHGVSLYKYTTHPFSTITSYKCPNQSPFSRIVLLSPREYNRSNSMDGMY